MEKMIEENKEKTLKEKWLMTDKTCPSCGQVTERVKGITKQNVKRLFTIKFTLNEIIITFMIIMIIIVAFAYLKETKICREWINGMFDNGYDECLRISQENCNIISGVSITKMNSTLEAPNISIKLVV
jgi:hypothetical protein